MKKTKSPLFLILLGMLLTACNLPRAAATPRSEDIPSLALPTSGVDTNLLATVVAATLQALTPAATSTLTLPSPTSTPALTDTPTATPTQTVTFTSPVTATLTPTETPSPGTIAGGIYGYPYGSVPRLVIVAFNQEKPYYWWLIIPAGSTWYSMDEFIPPGKYQVVAYDAAGHAGGCPSIVTVKGGQTATCDITDWSGGYRAKPADVPSP